MQLVTHNKVNKRYFEKGSAPKKKDWIELIESGAINGKVVLDFVYIDVDAFLAKDCFTPIEKQVQINLLD